MPSADALLLELLRKVESLTEGLAITKTLTERNKTDLERLSEKNDREREAIYSEISDGDSGTCERCDRKREECPLRQYRDLLEDMRRDKWLRSRMSKVIWSLALILLGGFTSALFRWVFEKISSGS